MDQRDYETLMGHTTGAMVPMHSNGHHPALPPHPSHVAPHLAPQHPSHAAPHVDVHAMQREMSQMREAMAHMHQQNQQRHVPPPAAHYPQSQHGAHYPGNPQHQDYAGRARHGASHSPHATNVQDIRNFPIGFVKEQIAGGQVAEIEVKPQVRFQGHRLAVSPQNARFFNIVDIKVGKDSQLAATGEMPAEAFSALAVGTQMELDPAPPGIVITLLVRNTDPAPQNFGAVLYGTVEEVPG